MCLSILSFQGLLRDKFCTMDIPSPVFSIYLFVCIRMGISMSWEVREQPGGWFSLILFPGHPSSGLTACKLWSQLSGPAFIPLLLA